ncbi:MAG: thiamine pyrophosphate-dependent dehydrogenase E1 component subunit alpha [Chloroflexi bacterium]|nr:thiamine pyrophosphate-dependent dehydrogenase E1 component subunit alpha [Chloroflexota bacterium]
MAQPDLLELYRVMLLARMIDERIWFLNRQGRAHFAVPVAGHEGVAGYAFALNPPQDYVVPHYRDLAALLHFGLTSQEVFLNLFAKPADPNSAGRQMFAHWSNPQKHILSLSSPQPNHITHAVGVALASKIRGEKSVTWAGFGDGSSSKGDIHESMNFASIHKLPIVFCCENNRYAISVPQEKQMAVQNVADRASGYGMPGVVVNGNDPLEVYQVACKAVERARRGEGPSLIEIKTYRFLPHTSNDDDKRYRSPEELLAERANDPVTLFREVIIHEKIWDDAHDQALKRELQKEIDDAQAFAEASPAAEPEDAFTNVYAS